MRRWTCARGTESCGYCQRTIAAGQPVLAVSFGGRTAERYRCADHTDGEPVNWTEVDNERWRREREAQIEAANMPEPPRLKEPAPARETPMGQFLPIHGFARQVFDPKAAAAGRDD